MLLDLEASFGPLAGIERALHVAHAPLLLVLAVDLPDMTGKFLQKLIARCDPHTGVVPKRANGFEPLAAISPKSAVAPASCTSCPSLCRTTRASRIGTAPLTCATRHISSYMTTNSVVKGNSHDVGERISWTLRPVVSAKLNLVVFTDGAKDDCPESKPLPKVGDTVNTIEKVVENEKMISKTVPRKVAQIIPGRNGAAR
ncbi:MAG: NTP transferase domain-containing protein [Verrucomicrobia bacterium]|nr:NTP transferase domain-containing protein [Verrucomicrobiota bacterium]